MANTDIREASTGAAVKNAIEKRYPYVLQSGENAADLSPGLTHSIQLNGRIFTRDNSDTTTPNDGTYCIVTSGGVRFKSDGLGVGPVVRRFAVQSILSSPPANPAVGFSCMVGVGGTGVFATRDGQIASWTSAGYEFIAPKVYDEAHVASLSQTYHYTATSTWVSGFSGFAPQNNSVSFQSLKHGLGLSVESASLNAPPPSPVNGTTYIVGPSPTGAWANQALKLAEFASSAWTFTQPQIGWQVYNKSQKANFVYTASGWQSLLSGYSKVTYLQSSTPILWGAPDLGYIYSDTTAPALAQSTQTIVDFPYTCSSISSKIEIEVVFHRFRFATVANQNIVQSTFALFEDNISNALFWSENKSRELYVLTPASVQQKTYKIRACTFKTNNIALNGAFGIRGYDIIVRETF